MSVDGFAPSLAFAAVAAIASVFTRLAIGPVVGVSDALALHLAGSLVAYAIAVAPTRRAALGSGALALAGLTAVALVVDSVDGFVLGATFVLALVRTGLSPRRQGARHWTAEGLLGLAALGFAAWLGHPGPIGTAVALWGYGLVQSLYFLVPGRSTRSQRGNTDPFDRACQRLEALLAEP